MQCMASWETFHINNYNTIITTGRFHPQLESTYIIYLLKKGAAHTGPTHARGQL